MSLEQFAQFCKTPLISLPALTGRTRGALFNEHAFFGADLVNVAKRVPDMSAAGWGVLHDWATSLSVPSAEDTRSGYFLDPHALLPDGRQMGNVLQEAGFPRMTPRNADITKALSAAGLVRSMSPKIEVEAALRAAGLTHPEEMDLAKIQRLYDAIDRAVLDGPSDAGPSLGAIASKLGLNMIQLDANKPLEDVDRTVLALLAATPQALDLYNFLTDTEVENALLQDYAWLLGNKGNQGNQGKPMRDFVAAVRKSEPAMAQTLADKVGALGACVPYKLQKSLYARLAEVYGYGITVLRGPGPK